jgi:hypothetical protein
MDENPWQTPLNKRGGKKEQESMETKKICKIVTLL